MEHLKKAIQAIAAHDVEPASVSVAFQPKTQISQILGWVGGYLAENPNSVLELYVHRARPGPAPISVRVTMNSMARAMGSLEFTAPLGSFGDAGYGGLPGVPRYSTRRYKCPKCGREVDVIPIDGLPTPMCINKHSPLHMEMME